MRRQRRAPARVKVTIRPEVESRNEIGLAFDQSAFRLISIDDTDLRAHPSMPPGRTLDEFRQKANDVTRRPIMPSPTSRLEHP
ncbi:MAG: hypothetical protein KDH16_08420 [Rhodocyclaceae bacterium]|nr:hypothetical protein [Rhodocyclaceae bacterium]